MLGAMSAPDDPHGFFAGFLVAAAFFTRLPVVPERLGPWRLADSAWAFPLVGAGIGLVAALALLLAQMIGLGSWPAALLSVSAGLALTGALHEDGLADTADGFVGGHDHATKLAIMRDSRHGTYGVLAIVVSVLLRVSSIAAIGDILHAGPALIAAHAASRATLPGALWRLPPARSEGVGAAAGRPGAPGIITAATIGAVIALAALGPLRGLIALCLLGVTVFAAAGVARRQIGGHTGDVLGALQQIGEIVMLLAASAR
jgi:adenosylcobinamide-GDP ribazoletransferase